MLEKKRDWTWLLPVAAYLGILAWNFDYSFMWDSSSYLVDCVLPATRKGLDLFALNCTDHPSLLYFLPFGLLQWWLPGNVLGIHLINAALGSAGIAAFLVTLRSASPSLASRPWETSLLACLVAVHPAYLSSTLFFNPDFGVAVFFLVALALFATGRLGWAVTAGSALVLSKEFGTPLYGLLSLAWLSGALPFGRATDRSRRAWILLSLPLVLFLGVQLGNYLVVGKWMLWKNWEGANEVAKARSAPFALAYVFALFVLNYHWVLTALACLGFGRWYRRERGAGDRKSQALFASLVLIPAAALIYLAGQIGFLNVRYLLCVHVALVLAYGVAVSRSVEKPALRVSATAVLLALFAGSVFRTTDPLSKAATGTFSFGSHEILKMTSLTGECCGHGRDQLVYNLEFIQFQRTFRKVLEQNDWKDTYLHIAPAAEFAVRESPTPELLRETILGTNPLLSGRSPKSYSRHVFVQFPNSESDIDLKSLPPGYEASREVVASGGYRLGYVRLEKRNDAKSARPPVGKT
jgi:hypothetical protein